MDKRFLSITVGVDMSFLYEQFDNPFAKQALDQINIPDYITDNLKFKMRPYQEESFKRYIFYYQDETLLTKSASQQHLLYNMEYLTLYGFP